VQVKRYAARNKVREVQLREFLGSLAGGEIPLGVLVTSSSITSAAARYHKERRAMREQILIVEGGQVVELLVHYVRRRGLTVTA
jgi:restriction endonuclease Mrr